MNCDT